MGVWKRKERLTIAVVEDAIRREKNDVMKVKKRCWLVRCQGLDEAGRPLITFSDFDRETTLVEYIKYVKSYLVDLGDVGGQDKAVALLVKDEADNRPRRKG